MRSPVGWVAHCFKCGGSGFKHSRVAALRKETATRVSSPFIAPVVKDIDPSNYEHSRALNKLGMLGWIDSLSMSRLSIDDDRVYFPLHRLYRNEEHIQYTEAGWAGRLINNTASASSPKWRIASPPYTGESTLVFKHTNVTVPENVVVVEDPISALKIGQLVPHTMGIAMLGLSIGPLLLEYLCSLPSSMLVVIWPDGDGKGIERGTELFKQLKFLRPDSTEFMVASGLDPKHLSHDYLRSEIARLREKVSTGT